MAVMAAGSDTLAALRRGALAEIREPRLPPGPGEVPNPVFGLAETLEVLDLSDCGLDPTTWAGSSISACCSAPATASTDCRPRLGIAVALSQIGFRGTGLREVPAEALPPKLRWFKTAEPQANATALDRPTAIFAPSSHGIRE